MCGGILGLSTMVSPSVSPVRLTSSPLDMAQSPSSSPPKISLGKRTASGFLNPSMEPKQKPLGLSPLGLNLASPGLNSSIGISSPSPRILLRPEVAAYLARGWFFLQICLLVLKIYSCNGKQSYRWEKAELFSRLFIALRSFGFLLNNLN